MKCTRPRLAVILAAVLCAAACDESPTSGSPEPQLRIRLSGTARVEDLVVLFPGSRVPFGTVQGGTTSAYRGVPGGVYRYAAYEFVLDGTAFRQPVIDWVGESPMEGRQFTYTIEVLPAGPLRLNLVNVTRDQ